MRRKACYGVLLILLTQQLLTSRQVTCRVVSTLEQPMAVLVVLAQPRRHPYTRVWLQALSHRCGSLRSSQALSTWCLHSIWVTSESSSDNLLSHLSQRFSGALSLFGEMRSCHDLLLQSRISLNSSLTCSSSSPSCPCTAFM